MAFGCHIGSFTKSTTTSGFPFNQDITDAAITDTPKLVILWTTPTTGDAAYEGDTNNTGFSIGFATAASAGKMHSVGMFEDDAAGTSDTYRWLVNNSSTAWMRNYNAAGTLQWEFHLNSFLSNGFRITYNATNNNIAYVINYLVMWGSDITVNSGSYTATAGPDNVAHGLGATPNFVMFLSGVGSSDNQAQAHGGFMVGMASSTSASNQASIAIASEDGRVNMDTWRYMPASTAIGITDPATGAINAVGTITGMDSTNFTVTWSDTPSAGAALIQWLAISGGSHNIHTMAAPAATGNQSKTGLSFQPVGLFAFSRGATASTTSDAHAMISAGAAKSSSLHRAATYASEDNTADCEALVRSTGSYIVEISPTDVNATAASTGAPTMQVEIVTMNSDGYTWNYDATITNAVIAVWAFAGTPVAAPLPNTSSLALLGAGT